MISTRSPASYILALLVAAGPSLQDYNPVTNFCRRWGHRTAVVNNVLYTDGGMVNYISGSTMSANMTNAFFLNQPLDHVNSLGMPPLYNNITKPGSAPSTYGGALWGDDVNNVIYFYGGEYTNTNPPNSASLWQYDITHSNWSTVSYQQTFPVNGLAHGGSVSPPGYGYGYYYGGWLRNTTSGSWTSPLGIASPNLLIYNMDEQSWQNSSQPDDGRPRAEGSMVFLPMSDRGMLVYIGGVIDLGNGSTTAQPMNKIMLYDIANPRWYTQTASGDIPGNRRLFCAGAAWAKDRSSYNIYIYGGMDVHEGWGYDDLYILSIPSFRWIQMGEQGQYYKNQATCNMVTNNAQMLVIGGSRPNSSVSDCDSPNVWGNHNLDTGEQNTDHASWLAYTPTKTTYVVPTDVINVIGGSSLGVATLTTPSGGFDNADLAIFMTRVAVSPTRTPSSTLGPISSPSHGLSKGTIAGIAIGAVAGLLFIGGISFLLIRRRYLKQREQLPALIQTAPPPGGPLSPTSPMSMHMPHSQYSGFLLGPMAPPSEVHVPTPPPVELPTAESNSYNLETAAAGHFQTASPTPTNGSATVTMDSASPVTGEDKRLMSGYGPRSPVTPESPVYARAGPSTR
ncbi:hypothetical protein TD95_003438 [Thielaviopsis punctulata]|uniref:Uncharacterized protein n=1 Tax=Thielaviopsis punctulata TaxID=72032 RepID=A0A0F4ZF10_9PEZI|nr:hypothetical protein TD95_003438 [Thielaviopsis punctulata]